MSVSCPELLVEVHRRGNHYISIVTDESGQAILSHQFQYARIAPPRPTPLRSEDSGRPHTGKKNDPNQQPLGNIADRDVVRGRRLFKYLFGNGQRLANYLNSSPDCQHRHLTLLIGEDALPLWRLPWERLHDGNGFPCLEGTLLISRRLANIHPTPIPSTSAPPLRILVIAPIPYGQPPSGIGSEGGLLQEALNNLISSSILDIDILSEPTLSTLLESLKQQQYHIIHYIGHGSYHLEQHQGFLHFEDWLGREELVTGAHLAHLLEKSLPHLFLLSEGESWSNRMGTFDAFTDVAVDLLRGGTPSVLSIPEILEPASARAFYKTFYTGLAQGRTLSESLHTGRAALGQSHPPPRLQRSDWSLPTLYQRASNIQPISRSPKPEGTPPQVSSIPYDLFRRPLVGRKRELRAIREAMEARTNIFYILGHEGIGKHTLVSYLLTHADPKPTAVLQIRCRQTIEPLLALDKIARFWRSTAQEIGRQAADRLLDTSREPLERAREAQQLLSSKRYILYFSDLDAWFTLGSDDDARIENGLLREILLGLISANSKTLFFFTATRRWSDLSGLSPEKQREIRLPLLNLGPTIQLMNRLPELRRASWAKKKSFYQLLRGHPGALRLLNGLLSFGRDSVSLITAPPLKEDSTEAWVAYLATEVLSSIDPGERQALTALAVLRLPFSAATVAGLSLITAQHAPATLQRWLRAGLIEPVPTTTDETQFILHPAIRTALRERLNADEIQTLHLQAAAWYGAPFIDAARRQILTHNLASWPEDRIEWLAQDANGILGIWLRQQQDRAQRLIERALAWQYHLSEAGKIPAASQIIQTLIPYLERHGQHDLAQTLHQRALAPSQSAALSSDSKALAQPRLKEDPISAALEVYEEVQRALDSQQQQSQRAYILLRAGDTHYRLGHAKEAIERYREALRLMRRIGDDEGAARCHRKLATVYSEIGDLREALTCNQAAKEYYEALPASYELVELEYEGGEILNRLGKLEEALERFTNSLQLCRKLADQQGVADNLTEIGRVLDKMGKLEMAIRVIQEAAKRYERLQSLSYRDTLSLLNRLAERKRRIDEAVAKFHEAKRASQPRANN